MELSKLNPSNPSSTKIFSKFVNLTNVPMDGISFQVRGYVCVYIDTLDCFVS